MTNLHRYYKDNKDDINSSIMELACDLAAARLMNEHGQPFEAFVEADDPDDPEGGTHYKEEFQDEFDRYYDEQYDRIVRLMKFDFNADDGVAHDNAAGSSENTGTPDSDRLAIADETCEVIDIVTTPDAYPELFRRRVKCLTGSGLPQSEAEKFVASTPLKLELFYDIDRGGFAIDAEAVGNMPLYNPYTGQEISDETE